MSDPVQSAEWRQQRSRLGAYALHATHDPRETTKPARAAFNARFEREVDPEGKLDPAERLRRAEFAKKAHFLRLAMASAKARRKEAPK
jgi:hypothetical protein